MKQGSDQVDADRSHLGTGLNKAAHAPAINRPPSRTLATPAPTSGTWLAEALKLWCAEPQTAS